MSNNKQSSVDWYGRELDELFLKYQKGDMSSGKYISEKFKLEQQAVAMHEEEIIDANFYGQRLHAKSVTNTMMEANATEYYNETYGGNNEQQ